MPSTFETIDTTTILVGNLALFCNIDDPACRLFYLDEGIIVLHVVDGIADEIGVKMGRHSYRKLVHIVVVYEDDVLILLL